MATYSQWSARAAKGEVKRVTWLCGPERVLVEEVVSATRDVLAPAPQNYVSYSAVSDSEREIWAACGQYPADSDSVRLVVVRDAEQLKSWHMMEPLVSAGREMRKVYLLFVSNDPDYESKDGKRERHIALIGGVNSGQLVRCKLPSEDDLMAWVERKLPGLGKNLAWHLLTRTGGDLHAAADVCAKGALLGNLSEGVIDALCTARPAEGFADSVALLRKSEALMSASALDERELGRALGLLESRLDLLSVLNTALRQRMHERDIVVELRVHPLLVRKFKGVATSYDPERVRACRTALAVADSAWRSGAREGVAEALAALW